MKTAQVRLLNRLGLHARPVAKLVKISTELPSHVRLIKGEMEADIRDIYSLMSLGAKYGETLTICVEGDREDEALAMIQGLFQNRFGEEA